MIPSDVDSSHEQSGQSPLGDRLGRILRHPWTAALGVGALAFVVFAVTAYRGPGGRLMPVDSSGHQYYGRVVGPFDSAWHPLYYTSTWLWERLRLAGTRSDQITLFSSLFGAVTVMLLHRLCERLVQSRLAAAVGALSLAFGYAFWTQSTDAEVYTMQASCTVGVLLLLLEWRDTRQSVWYLLACFVYAQSFGVHLMMGLLLPSFAYVVFSTDARVVRRPALFATVVAFIGLGLLQYVGAYVRDWNHEHLAWGVDAPRTLQGYIWTVMGDHWKGVMMSYSLRDMLTDRFPLFLWMWTLQIGPVGIVLAVLGIPLLWRRDRRAATAIFLAAGLTAVYAMGYDVMDTEVFLLPVWVLLAPCVAATAAHALEWARPRGGLARLVPLALCGWIVFLVAWTKPALDQDHNIFEPVRRFLGALPPKSLLVHPGQPWELTMVLRNFLYNEPGMFKPKDIRYIESVEEVPTGQRVHLGDPDVEIPSALERGTPVFVTQSDLSATPHCPLVRLETTLEDIALQADPFDLVAIVWQNEGRVVDDTTRRGLERLHLSGLLEDPRTLQYVGLGCLPKGCKGLEATTRDLARPLEVTARTGQELGAGARAPVDLRVAVVRGGFSQDGRIDVAGKDALVPQRRGPATGLPKRRSGTTHIVHDVLSYARTITGSAVVVIDGATGAIKRRYHTERGALAFDHKMSVCRVDSPRRFDAGGDLDLGSMRARAYLGSGYWVDQYDDGRSAVNSHGEMSTLWIPMTRPQHAYRLLLTARAMYDDTQQAITVEVNGQRAGTIKLDRPGYHTHALDLPPGVFKPGTNRVRLSYARPRSPEDAYGQFAVDKRVLAVWLDRFELQPRGLRSRVTFDDLPPSAAKRGFSPPERMGQITAAWAAGEARITLHHGGDGPATLRFYARAHERVPSQTVSASVNGTALPPVRLGPEWAGHAIAVPAGALREGDNDVVLRFSGAAESPPAELDDPARPALRRYMTAAFQRVELVSGLDGDGVLDPGAIAMLGRGFATPEEDEEAGRWVWAIAPEVTLAAPMRTAGARVLELRARAAEDRPQPVEVLVDGHEKGKLVLAPGFHDHKLELGELAPGDHKITLRFGYQRAPTKDDARPLTAAFERVSITGAP